MPITTRHIAQTNRKTFGDKVTLVPFLKDNLYITETASYEVISMLNDAFEVGYV